MAYNAYRSEETNISKKRFPIGMKIKNHVILLEQGSGLCGIQLMVEDEPVLVVGRGGHSETLRRGLEHLGIPYEWMATDDEPIVAPIGKNYQAVGMGMCITIGGWISIRGGSDTYMMEKNEKHLQQLKPYLPDTEIF